MTQTDYCNECTNTIDALYRFAYLTLGDQDASCELVTAVCVWGSRKSERIASIRHGALFKSLISIVVGLLLGSVPLVAHRGSKD